MYIKEAPGFRPNPRGYVEWFPGRKRLEFELKKGSEWPGPAQGGKVYRSVGVLVVGVGVGVVYRPRPAPAPGPAPAPTTTRVARRRAVRCRQRHK